MVDMAQQIHDDAPTPSLTASEVSGPWGCICDDFFEFDTDRERQGRLATALRALYLRVGLEQADEKDAKNCSH